MSDDRDPADLVPPTNETNGLLELPAGIFGTTKRRCPFRRPLHLGMGIGKPSEAVKVERPDVEPGRAQLVAPRPPVKSVRDRQTGGKRAAMYIEHNPVSSAVGRRQMAQKQRAPAAA